MAIDKLYIDLLAHAADVKPTDSLEARMIEFLEGENSTESLDGAEFDKINGSKSKADYLLGARGLVAELKTLNASPEKRIKQRLNERLSQPDAPVVFGTLDVSRIIDRLPDRDVISKMMVDMAGRPVRRHLQKANDQIGGIKNRLGLPDAGGLVILMNESERLVDVSAIGCSLKAAFETVEGGYPHITNVWVTVESHRITMPGGRLGFPHLHIFKPTKRQSELNYIARMFEAWGHRNGSEMERVPHHGDWNVMRAIYDGPPPTLQLFD